MITTYHPVTSCHPSSQEEGNPYYILHYATLLLSYIANSSILRSSFFIKKIYPSGWLPSSPPVLGGDAVIELCGGG